MQVRNESEEGTWQDIEVEGTWFDLSRVICEMHALCKTVTIAVFNCSSAD